MGRWLPLLLLPGQLFVALCWLFVLVFFFFTWVAPSSIDDVAHLHGHWVVEAVDGGGEPWWWRPLCIVEAEEQVVHIEVVLAVDWVVVDGWVWEQGGK